MAHCESGPLFEGQLPVESSAKMQAILEHMSAGCLQCADVLQQLQEARAQGARVRQPEPPEYAVDSAKDAFPTSRPVRAGRDRGPLGSGSLDEGLIQGVF